MDWCASRLKQLICSQIILMTSSPGSLFVFDSLAIHLSLASFAFRSSEVRHLLLDLDPYGGGGPYFLKRTAQVLAVLSSFSVLCLSVVFRWLVRLGSFPACWRQANVTPIPKGPPSSSVANYRPISITSVLSKMFQCLESVRLGRFMERSGVLPTTHFAYQKGLGTCNEVL